MGLDRDYRDYVSEIMDVKRVSDGYRTFRVTKNGISFKDSRDQNNVNETKKFGWKKHVRDLNEENDESLKSKQHNIRVCSADAGDFIQGNGETVALKQQNLVAGCARDGLSEEKHGGGNLNQVKRKTSFLRGISSNGSHTGRFSATPVVVENVVKSSENSVASKKCSGNDDAKELMNLNLRVSKEVYNQKRKRDCFLGMLRWMANVAKDPTTDNIGEIPESSRWSSYGHDNIRKQVLLAREALFLKRIRNNHSADQFGCQKKQKMSPSLLKPCENLPMNTSYQSEANPPRPRQRLEARLDMQPTASIYTSRPQQRIPVGKPFQADVPEWTGAPIKSDSKWLGTRTWPLERAETSFSVKRDPIGMGRVDSCNCQIPGSTHCVKVHISEKRMNTRYELSSAFYAWNFDKMGESCSDSWTVDEEKKFRSIVTENPVSSQKCFWEPMCAALPQKSWPDQVNYYFNVYKLRCRAHQNRHHPGDIDSDDDETEF